ncbi:MAG: hypothetical protein ACO1ON_12020 [Nocardioides sp.]
METPASEISYAAWGRAFFREAVSVERVLAAVNVLSGQPVDLGPLGVGPGRVARVTAQGAIGEAWGHRVGDDPVAFAVRLPVAVTFTLDLGVDKQVFAADLEVPLLITGRARADLTITLDIEPPRPHQIAVDLRAQGLRASLTKHAAGVQGELQRFVARYVAREVEKDYVLRVRTIDVSAAIDRALVTLAPQRPV